MDNAEKKKIMLIDDDEMHLITAELYLKDDYEILKNKSGEEALNHINNNGYVPNLILLDILMPEMNGWEVFKKLRAIPSLKNTPIVFLTSEDTQADKDRAFKIGAADYITKPFNMTLLKSKVKDILSKKR